LHPTTSSYFSTFSSLCRAGPGSGRAVPTRRSSDLHLANPQTAFFGSAPRPRRTPGTPARSARPPETHLSPSRPDAATSPAQPRRSEEHTSELQSRENLVCRLLLEKKNNHDNIY